MDFLTKKQKINEGEIPQYYVEHSHEAIIPRGIHDLVQDEMKRRKEIGKQYSAAGAFSGKLICGECGGLYGSKVWHSTSKYRRVIWRCNEKYKNDAPCSTPHLNEEEIKNAFVSAFNRQIDNKKAIIAEIEKTVINLIDKPDIDSEIQTLTEKRDSIAEMIKECIEENTVKALDQSDYERRYNTLAERYESTVKRMNELYDKQEHRDAKLRQISRCLEVIRGTDTLLTEFDEKMWNIMLESATVYSRERIVFLFADGTEVVLFMVNTATKRYNVSEQRKQVSKELYLPLYLSPINCITTFRRCSWRE